MTTRRRLGVVGGGIAGLAAAHRWCELERAAGRTPEVVLYEARERLGGPIRSVERDGFLLEEGPDSFLTEKSAARDLAQRLGLGARLIAVEPEARRSLLVRDGRLHPLPEGLFLLAPVALRPFFATPLLTWPGKLRAALEPFVPPRREPGDESVAQFVERRFGREMFEAIAEPLVSGIYGADPADLSVAATLPRFTALERDAGSVVRGLRARPKSEAAGARGARYGLFASFDRGLEVLVQALAAALPAGSLRLRTPVAHLGRCQDGTWEVAAESGSEHFGRLLLATPARVTAGWFASLDAELAAELARIPYRSSATLQLAYRDQDLPPWRAAGFVVPKREGFLLRGCTWSHRKYAGRAPAGFGLLRLYFGDDAAHLEAATVEARTRRELERLLGVRAEPRFSHWAAHTLAVPQYRVGHLELEQRVRARLQSHRGLALAGSAFGGVGIPDVIAGAIRAAEALYEEGGVEGGPDPARR